MCTKMISPSMLAADFGNIERDVKMLNQSSCDLLHIDVMDGTFVPNISFGFPVIEAIAKYSTKPLDIHLMITQPERYVELFAAFHPEYITVHQEACPHLHRTIQQIQSFGIKAGVALNPATPICAIEEVIPFADLFLIMSVNPGFGGQKFISTSHNKIQRLRQMIEQKNSSALIQVDGGVSPLNADDLYQSGANILVAGSAVFNSEDPLQTIAKMKE